MEIENKETDHFFIKSRILQLKTQFKKQLSIPKNLKNPHKLIKEVQDHFTERLKQLHYAPNEMIRSHDYYLDINTTKQNIKRTLIFANTFIKLIERLGHRVEFKNGETYCVIDDEYLRIKIREKSNWKIVKGKYGDRKMLVPNGKLSMNRYRYSIENEWIDGKQTLEEQIPKIIATLELVAKKEKEEQKQRDINYAIQMEQRLIERKKQAKLDWEIKKKDLLLSHSTQWKQANELLSFINTVEQKLQNTTNQTSQKVTNWLTWAKEVHHEINPIPNSPKSFLDLYEFDEDNVS